MWSSAVKFRTTGYDIFSITVSRERVGVFKLKVKFANKPRDDDNDGFCKMFPDIRTGLAQYTRLLVMFNDNVHFVGLHIVCSIKHTSCFFFPPRRCI